MQCIACPEVDPQAPIHFIVFSKRPVGPMSDCDDADKQVIGQRYSSQVVFKYSFVIFMPCFRKRNWTLCYFIMSLLRRLRIAWKFPVVHRSCCLLWIWNKCLWLISRDVAGLQNTHFIFMPLLAISRQSLFVFRLSMCPSVCDHIPKVSEHNAS